MGAVLPIARISRFEVAHRALLLISERVCREKLFHLTVPAHISQDLNRRRHCLTRSATNPTFHTSWVCIELVRSGMFNEQPRAMSRSPQAKMARWPKADKWGWKKQPSERYLEVAFVFRRATWLCE